MLYIYPLNSFLLFIICGMAAMRRSHSPVLAVLLLVALLWPSAVSPAAAKKEKQRVCNLGWECRASIYCCNGTISDFFRAEQFDELFSNRDAPVAQAAGFWDYQAFITAAAAYEPLGFGTTGGRLMQMREVAAFLAIVGSKTSCGRGVAAGDPLAWGLCYNREMSPSQAYCDGRSAAYPCTAGVEYYGRGALPVFWNYNYGALGEGLDVDLLNHPELLEQNATLAFQAAVYTWMSPVEAINRKKKELPPLPSPHDIFVGDWRPTKTDVSSGRLPGFGATMNALYGDSVSGQGDTDAINDIVSHYLHYLDLMGVGSQFAGENLDCSKQQAFVPSSSSSSSPPSSTATATTTTATSSTSSSS